VVEISAEIPLTVPGMFFEGGFQAGHVEPPSFGALVLAAGVGDRRENIQHMMQEPSEPDAFALAARADEIHAIVPVALAHEGKAVRPVGEAAIDGAGAMLEDRFGGF